MTPVCNAALVLILVTSVCTVYADQAGTPDTDTLPEITITTFDAGNDAGVIQASGLDGSDPGPDAGTISGPVIVSLPPGDPGVPDQTNSRTAPDIVSGSAAVVTVSQAGTGQITSPDPEYPQTPDPSDAVSTSTVPAAGCCPEDAGASSALDPGMPSLQSSAFPWQDTVLVAINQTAGSKPVMVSMNSSFEGPGPGLFRSVTDLLVLDGNLTVVITASPPGMDDHTIST